MLDGLDHGMTARGNVAAAKEFSEATKSQATDHFSILLCPLLGRAWPMDTAPGKHRHQLSRRHSYHNRIPGPCSDLTVISPKINKFF